MILENKLFHNGSYQKRSLTKNVEKINLTLFDELSVDGFKNTVVSFDYLCWFLATDLAF